MNRKVAKQFRIYSERTQALVAVVFAYDSRDALRTARNAEMIEPFISFRVISGTSIYIA